MSAEQLNPLDPRRVTPAVDPFGSKLVIQTVMAVMHSLGWPKARSLRAYPAIGASVSSRLEPEGWIEKLRMTVLASTALVITELLKGNARFFNRCLAEVALLRSTGSAGGGQRLTYSPQSVAQYRRRFLTLAPVIPAPR